MVNSTSLGRNVAHQQYPLYLSPLMHLWGLVAWMLLAFGSFLVSVVRWMAHTWPSLSSDEILFHLTASLEGTDTTVVSDYCLHYLPVVAGVGSFAFVLSLLARRKSLTTRMALMSLNTLCGILLVCFAQWNFGRLVDLRSFVPSEGEDFVGEHYVSPSDTKVDFPAKKRNLIYIYLESMELTFADEANGGAWDEDLIPELTELAHERGETFAGNSSTLNGAIALPGCTWTMGGLFAQSSGVPLKLPTHGNRSSLVLDDFFPELDCLGDVLAQQGYQQYALFGSNADFGNRRAYYTEHGNYDIFDYPRAIEEGFIPEDYKVWWGFEDERLYEKAREIITDAADRGEPFNLTMLTVDTHAEDGYRCRLCTDEHGDNRYANAMSCASRQASAFVRWVLDQEVGANTTIIINGDHCSMDKDFCENVPDSYQRRTFTCVINGAAQASDPASRRTYATIDLYPTTLAALGCTIEGDRLGLGTNLYGTRPTIIEEYGLDTCEDAFSRQSEFLDAYSNAPTGEELVDKMLEEVELKLDYANTGKEHSTGFFLRGVYNFNAEIIEDAHLELTDTRTGTTESYPLQIWRNNKNWVTAYNLHAFVDIPDDELQFYTAEAYMTIRDDRDRLYASWNGAEASQATAEATDANETS